VRHDITIRHIGYGDPVADQRKAQRNLRLLRLEYATDPTDPMTMFYLGLTHLRLGQMTTGLGFLQNSHKTATGNADWMRSLYALLRETLQAAGRLQESLAIGAEAIQRFPGDPVLTTAHATLLIQLGQPAEAEQLLTALVQRPASALLANGSERTLDLCEARHLLGVICQEQGRYAEAEAHFRNLLADHPTYLLPWVSLGYVCLLQGRLDETEQVSRQIDATGTDPAYGLVMRAEVHSARGQYQAAMELVEQAIARAPRFPWARVVRANVLMRSGADRESCLAALRDVQRLSPECVRTARQIAELERVAHQPRAVSPPHQSISIMSSF
jgi:predicted Zn-dependent protease